MAPKFSYKQASFALSKHTQSVLVLSVMDIHDSLSVAAVVVVVTKKVEQLQRQKQLFLINLLLLVAS